MNSRKLEDLDPDARAVCQAHLALCHAAGIELIVTSTWRDYEAQNALYAIGRTVDIERRCVTNAKAGHSFHNFKCAYDVVPVINGKPVWDERDPLWKEVIRLGPAPAARWCARSTHRTTRDRFRRDAGRQSIDRAGSLRIVRGC